MSKSQTQAALNWFASLSEDTAAIRKLIYYARRFPNIDQVYDLAYILLQRIRRVHKRSTNLASKPKYWQRQPEAFRTMLIQVWIDGTATRLRQLIGDPDW